MGRTKRRRIKKIKEKNSVNLENNADIVSLKKWMFKEEWKNESLLQIRNFSITGRGILSKRIIHENDTLINIPYNLLITYKTLHSVGLFSILVTNSKLKIHDLLALFIIFEKHKNDRSYYCNYINSLPKEQPCLPWLSSIESFTFYPLEINKMAVKCRNNFEESWLRVKKSIKKSLQCFYCKEITRDCVLDRNLYAWSYVMVNSRAVYVDPQIITQTCDFQTDFLSDEPSMALCPYLDMFNHSFTAKTDAKLNYSRQGQLFYQLVSLTKYRKYDQLFISYGPHDNIKLLMEYGFFLPGNTYDTINFTIKEILSVLDVNLNERIYKYVRDHNFCNDLYIANNGASFNLKALIFICFNNEIKLYSSVIFSGNYSSDFFIVLCDCLSRLLEYKTEIFKLDLNTFREHCNDVNEYDNLMLNYLKYRIEFVTTLKNKLFAN